MQDSTHTRGGQAMIEFVVAILLVVILITGLVQFIELAGAKGDLEARIRGEAGEQAIGGALPLLATPDYLRTWEEGADETRHTADDVPVPAQALNLQSRVVDRGAARPGDWRYLDDAVNRDLPDLQAAALPISAFGLVHEKLEETITLLPAMRDWILGRETVTVAAEVWLPHLSLEGFEP